MNFINPFDKKNKNASQQLPIFFFFVVVNDYWYNLMSKDILFLFILHWWVSLCKIVTPDVGSWWCHFHIGVTLSAV